MSDPSMKCPTESQQNRPANPVRDAILQSAHFMAMASISGSCACIGLVFGIWVGLALSAPHPQPYNGPKEHLSLPVDKPFIGTRAVVAGSKGLGAWSDIYESPRRDSLRSAQALVGEPVRILERRGGWLQVSIPGLSLTGWIQEHDVLPLTEGLQPIEIQASAMVTKAPGIQAGKGPYLPWGARLPLSRMTSDGGRVWLKLPSGQELAVATNDVRIGSRDLSLTEALLQIQQFRGVTYQDGANTREAMDAPGLIHLVFRLAGITVPRRLNDLLTGGIPIRLEQARAGDVVFLSTFNPDAPHPVLLLDEGRTFIHSSPSQGVALGLLAQLRNRTILSVRRFTNSE